MKRSERIYLYIKERSGAFKGQKLSGQIGFDAQEIADELDILRNNVSKELNELTASAGQDCKIYRTAGAVF